MKYIQKSKEPTCLTELKKQKGATFDDLNRKEVGEDKTCKEKVRKALLIEQGYLCAYCMQRISEAKNKFRKPKTEVEHWASQNRHPDLVLDYKNMLGVCNGNAGDPDSNSICDKSKSRFDKTDDLFVNPLNINRIKELEYLPNGEITSNNEKIKRDLKVILNLNEEALQERRAQLYEETRKKIRQIKRSLWNAPQTKKSELQKLKTEWEKRYDGKFRPLCRVPLYLIEKELTKL